MIPGVGYVIGVGLGLYLHLLLLQLQHGRQGVAFRVGPIAFPLKEFL